MNIFTSAFAATVIAFSGANAYSGEMCFNQQTQDHRAVHVTTTTQEMVEEVARQKILNRWKKRQKGAWRHLPKGDFVINASAYTAAADECGKSDGITASGVKVKEGRTLACPPQYPFGTRIHIDGMGTYTCEDRGGAIKGNRFDIYMKTKRQAFAFGRRHLTAHVVN